MTGEITARIDRNELLRLLDTMKPPAARPRSATRRTSEVAALLPPCAPVRRPRPTLTIPIPAVRPIAPAPVAPAQAARARVTIAPTARDASAPARSATARVAIAPVREAPLARFATILERFASFLFAGLCAACFVIGV